MTAARGDFQADGRAVDTGQVTEQHDPGGHHRSGVASTDECAGVAGLDELEADANRAVALAAQRLDGAVVHFDDLRSVMHVDRQIPNAVAVELAGDPLAVADQRDGNGELTGRVDRSLDDGFGGVIAAHGVDGNGFHGMRRRLSPPRSRPPVARDTDHSAGRRGGVAPAHRMRDMPRTAARRAHRVPGACCASDERSFASVRPSSLRSLAG